EFNESSVLALWTEEGPMIVKYQSSGRSVNVEIKIGYSPPLLISSIGKCFAAYLPHQTIKLIFEAEINRYGLDEKTVIEELNDIKEKGIASRDSHIGYLPGSQSMASPIFDYTGNIIGVLGIVGFAEDLNLES